MSINAVAITGILAREPRLDYPADGPITRLDVRCFSRRKTPGGKWEKINTVIPVVVKGPNAERVAGWLKEGLMVEIEGSLQGFDVATVDGKSKACAVLAKRVDQVKE